MNLNALEASLRVRIREKLNPYFGWMRRKKLRRQDFTIISNNCWAGHVYRYYNLPYMTPTVGMFFMAEDYVKFANNLRYYLGGGNPLIFNELPNGLKEKADRIRKIKQLECPIGFIDDVMIVFLHYKTEEEAREKWQRRCERIVWDNLLIKFSEQNECSCEHLRAFDEIGHESKFCFVSDPVGLESEVWFKEFSGNGEVPNDTINFKRYVNLTKWLNGDDDYRCR